MGTPCQTACPCHPLKLQKNRTSNETKGLLTSKLARPCHVTACRHADTDLVQCPRATQHDSVGLIFEQKPRFALLHSFFILLPHFLSLGSATLSLSPLTYLQRGEWVGLNYSNIRLILNRKFATSINLFPPFFLLNIVHLINEWWLNRLRSPLSVTCYLFMIIRFMAIVFTFYHITWASIQMPLLTASLILSHFHSKCV